MSPRAFTALLLCLSLIASDSIPVIAATVTGADEASSTAPEPENDKEQEPSRNDTGTDPSRKTDEPPSPDPTPAPETETGATELPPRDTETTEAPSAPPATDDTVVTEQPATAASSIPTSDPTAMSETINGSSDTIPEGSAPLTNVTTPTQESQTIVVPSVAASIFEETASDPLPVVILEEIQIEGLDEHGKTVANEEFIELYNRSDETVDLSGWKLQKMTSSGSRSSIKVIKDGCLFLEPGKRFLWTNSASGLVPVADTSTSASLAKNNTFELLDNEGNIIDSFEWGPDAHSGKSKVRNPNTLEWSDPGIPTPKGQEAACERKTVPPPPIGTILLNELFPYPESGSDEWIELQNTSSTAVDLSGWMLRDASGKTYTLPKGSVINNAGFLVIDGTASGIALNNTGSETLSLLFPNGSVADSFSYSKTEQAASYAYDGAMFRLTHSPTRGTVNVFDPAPATYPVPPAGTVRLNELFPNPKTKGESDEWIELKNTGNEPVTLIDWTLRSGAGKFVWSSKTNPAYATIPAHGYLVLPRSLTRLALRNSAGTVTLAAPDGATMDTVSYVKTTEDASYGPDGAGRFRWTKTKTPGTDNIFGKEPKTKEVSIQKTGYRKTLVPFSAEGNKKKMKYAWDFGDGHKSYLATTSHRYEKTGTYEGTLTLRDGIEEYVKPFTIRIVKYPSRDLHLTELCPNPTGRDTGTEWIRLRNDSRKRVSLAGWSIATATESSKLVNHVILSDASVDPGMEIILRHADSRFTLPNGQATIELRRPDGKAVQTIRYAYGKSVPDDAVYADTGGGWSWIVPSDETGTAIADAVDMATEEAATDEEEPLSGRTENPDTDRLAFDEFLTLGTPYRIDLPASAPRVLGVSDARTNATTADFNAHFFDNLFLFLNQAILNAFPGST